MITYGDIPRNYNLASDFLDRNLESGRAENVALYFDDRKITYAELAALSNRIGHVLLDLGVGIEDRVLLALNDCPEFVAAWYATLKIGAVVAEVYTFLQPQDYAYYLNYTRAKSVIVDSTTLPKVREVEPACRHLDHILVVGTAELLGRKEISLAPALVQAPAELKPENTTKDDIALWKFTTGSTGKPKAAVHCHHDPRISFESYAKGVLQMTAEDRVLAVPKLFFGYARDLVSLFAFGVGAAGIIFSERSTPGRIFELIERHRPTLLVNVPTMMNQMVSYPDAASKDLSCLRLNISSGEALPPDLHRDWLRLFGVETLEGIGSSEAYHIYISNRPGQARPGSVGQIVPGYKASVVDDQGHPVSDGEIGELWLEGESTAILYWNDHIKSKETFLGDRIHTGDMFKRDEDGYFWYQGRADSLMKVSGIWLSPIEIENCLREHPDVRECAVVGYSEGGLVLPRAFVVPRDMALASPAMAVALQAYVREQLAPHKYPRDVHFVREIPKTSSGKLDRKALLVNFEQARSQN